MPKISKIPLNISKGGGITLTPLSFLNAPDDLKCLRICFLVFNAVQQDVSRGEVQNYICSRPWAEICSHPWAEICSRLWAKISSHPWAKISSRLWGKISSHPWAEIFSRPWAEIFSRPWAEICSHPWEGIFSSPWAKICSRPYEKILYTAIFYDLHIPPCDIEFLISPRNKKQVGLFYLFSTLKGHWG